MLAQKGGKSKRAKMLGLVAVLLLLVIAALLYYLFFTGPDADLVGADRVQPAQRVQTNFNTELFDDERFKRLKLYGPGEVRVEQRGRVADPFKPF